MPTLTQQYTHIYASKVAISFGVDAKLLLVRGHHTKTISQARQVLAYLLREDGFSFPEIAEALGLDDHSTVMARCKKVAATPHLKTVADEIRAEIVRGRGTVEQNTTTSKMKDLVVEIERAAEVFMNIAERLRALLGGIVEK